LVRKPRPDVVMIENFKKPNKNTTASDAAKYGCVFLDLGHFSQDQWTCQI